MRWGRIIAIGTMAALLVTGFSGCRQKGENVRKGETFITFYGFNEDESVLKPLMEEYRSQNKNIRILYKNFTDIEEYEDTIVNEMAEGAGPDIFNIQNAWMGKHWRKITPLPPEKLTAERFEEAFVQIAAKDLLRTDENGERRIYALPLYVDSLALYYNKSHYEEKMPQRGRPSSTWEGLKDDVFRLTVPDNSFERFERTGIALGRSDNIGHAVDIVLLLFLQHGANFYNQDGSQAVFAQRQGGNILGGSAVPGLAALEFFTSFAREDNKNYSWNEAMANPESDFGEIEAFARGKVSTIVGYATDYEKIKTAIAVLDGKNMEHMDQDDVRTATIPQINPEKEQITYASYFAPTVSRTSENPGAAWDFLMFLATRKSQEHYFERTHKPAARRDLINVQARDPIYGPFVAQLGFADSIQQYKHEKIAAIFREAIAEALKTEKLQNVLQAAENKINQLLPEDGIL